VHSDKIKEQKSKSKNQNAKLWNPDKSGWPFYFDGLGKENQKEGYSHKGSKTRREYRIMNVE